MSKSLSNSFGNVKITAAPSTKIQVALPDLNTNGRICFYGYDVSTEWLIDYTNKHWKAIAEYDNLAKASAAIKLLRSHSGIKRLEYESAFEDPSAPAGTVTIPGHRPGEIRVPLVSVFSNEVSSFPRRPSQARIDRLSEILGGNQPRWWVDYEDPRSYEC
ncbi:hypothetical protein L208DRAFT_1385050 [Tricholoma matsutake]|nr:hypothetical protein L208DRAFT_1385050 [Tricholoma matsutake 945]